MSDTIELTLPVSNAKVVIRGYTTRADDAAADQVLFEGVYADGTGEVKMPGVNGIRKQHLLVERLVQSIDGDSSDVVNRLQDLRTADYDHIKQAVDKVVEDNSPKA